ncbi:ribose-phosphate pyrophosphokinase [Paenibacillus sp. FSL H8-0537]|uniref:ribose-phosphate pyrophosphokinase n=1 Tax=Paenibacillus sp. FSL H8-0537 TaxID=2921399 RepID=UPI003100E6F8
MIKLNGTELAFKTFPNGETLVDGDAITELMAEQNTLAFKYENDSDLIKLMFVKQYLDSRKVHADLTIAYMPYSRMDRIEGASVFTLKYVCGLINSLAFGQVTVLEPHSDVTLALLNNCSARYPTIELLDLVVEATGFDRAADYLFFPDAGAQKRYSKVRGYNELVGFKARNFQTGEIERLDVVGQVASEGFKAIIVDDLCSYGGTFMRSAEKLKGLGAAEIYLLVGHCEPSIHKGKLLDSPLIDKVFTTNTMLNEAGHEKIQLFEWGEV